MLVSYLIMNVICDIIYYTNKTASPCQRLKYKKYNEEFDYFWHKFFIPNPLRFD